MFDIHEMGTMWPMQTLGSFDLRYWKMCDHDFFIFVMFVCFNFFVVFKMFFLNKLEVKANNFS
jgi:hypothetical protein